MTTAAGKARGAAWSEAEVAATVADYLHMLRLQYAGQRFNKAEHRRRLLARLEGRSPSAVEMKHQNISAVLRDLGLHWLTGYQPLGNYQQALADEVALQVAADGSLERVAAQAVAAEAEVPVLEAIEARLEDPPPPPRLRVADEGALPRVRLPFKRDYVEREARNRSLGFAGERFVLEFEARRLHAAGHRVLADRVEHVAATRGDGLGYDVLSFEPNGRERYIEVKTTAFSKATPFFLSAGEKRFSEEVGDRFHLARVFDFRTDPRLYCLSGAITTTCRLDPISWRATPF